MITENLLHKFTLLCDTSVSLINQEITRMFLTSTIFLNAIDFVKGIALLILMSLFKMPSRVL